MDARVKEAMDTWAKADDAKKAEERRIAFLRFPPVNAAGVVVGEVPPKGLSLSTLQRKERKLYDEYLLACDLYGEPTDEELFGTDSEELQGGA